MVKALIFDFDGVLVSSEGPRFKAVQAIAAEHGVIIEDGAIKYALGRTTANFIERILPDNPQLVKTLLEEFKAKYIKNITEYVSPIDFTVEFIREYKGDLPIAIASMSSLESIGKLTKHFGIFEKISHITTRDEVIHHKPDPEIYLKTAAKVAVLPQECLVFEYTVLGVQAAINANMSCCVVLNGLNDKKEFEKMPVDAFISDKQSLDELIRNI